MVTLHSERNKIWIELNLFENDRSQFPLLMRGLNLMLYFFLFWTACNWRWPLSNSANKTMRIALFELSRSFSIGLNWNCRRIWCEHIYCNCIFIAIIILNSYDDHRLFNFSIQAMWMGHVYGHIESTQFNCSVCWIDITFARFTFSFVLRTFWVTTYVKGHDCSMDNDNISSIFRNILIVLYCKKNSHNFLWIYGLSFKFYCQFVYFQLKTCHTFIHFSTENSVFWASSFCCCFLPNSVLID